MVNVLKNCFLSKGFGESYNCDWSRKQRRKSELAPEVFFPQSRQHRCSRLLMQLTAIQCFSLWDSLIPAQTSVAVSLCGTQNAEWKVSPWSTCSWVRTGPLWSSETEIYSDQHLAFVLVSLLREGDAGSSVKSHRGIGRIPPTQGNTMRLGKVFFALIPWNHGTWLLNITLFCSFWF